MTAREFLDGFRPDGRLVSGGYYSQDPVLVASGDTVGVVLLNLGGPRSAEGVAPFLFNRLMDPAAFDVPLPAALRERLCRRLARRWARAMARDYEQIGGAALVNRHTEEQARALEARLNERFGPVTGARFRLYTAMRYGQPTSEQAADRMRHDGVNKVVLLPLYPQYSKTTTGAALGYWKTLEGRGELPRWPTTFVYEYSAHPKLVQALSERIDEGLQRFPRGVRARVHLVFAARGTARRERTKHRDPYCCLVHAAVQEVMSHREAHDAGRSFHVAFARPPGPAPALAPALPETLDALGEDGHAAVLAVPIACVSDHVETAFGLDIAMRERALRAGIEHYEVASGLNSHPLFIEALAECVAAQVAPAVLAQGDGADPLPAALPALPRYAVGRRTVRCASCPFVTEAHDWSGEPAVHVPAPVQA